MTSNQKVSVYQRKQLQKKRDNPQNGRKILGKYLLNIGITPRMYKELKNLNTKRTNNPSNKCTKYLNRQFQKESTNVKKIHEEIFSILSHKENENQNDIEIQLLPSQNGSHQDIHNKCWQEVG
jgi:hypothetical protein